MSKGKVVVAVIGIILLAVAAYFFSAFYLKPRLSRDFTLTGVPEVGNVVEGADVGSIIGSAADANPFENTNPFAYQNPFR